jgi:S-adenosylmethionine decarboxylase
VDKYLSIHILLDLYGCTLDLNDMELIHKLMLEAALKAKTTVLNSYAHQFTPQGVSCVVVISESHLSIHTWPEFKHAEIDVFTCGDNALPTLAVDYLQTRLNPLRAVIHKQKRGEIKIISSYETK